MKRFFSYFIFLILIFFSFSLAVSAKEIVAPSILEIGEKTSSENISKYYIKGLTEADTDVLIYINGTFVDYAKINIEDTGTDNFYFENNIESETFEVMAIARDKKTYVLSPPSIHKYKMLPVPAPTIIFPENGKKIINTKIDVVALTKTNSIVDIYIDSVHVGETEYLTHESGTANFVFHGDSILKPGGHSLYLIAQDKLGRTSKISDIIYFEIEHPMPAPILFEPVINETTTANRPFVVGVAKNDSLVKVFVDNKYDGEFLVKNDKSGTANFAYKPQEALNRGSHVFYTTAVDKNNKESKFSNIVKFKTRQPIIAEAVQAKNEDILNEVAIDKKKEFLTASSSVEAVIEKEKENKTIKNNKIEKNLNTENTPVASLEDNNKTNQDEETGLEKNIDSKLSEANDVNSGSLNEDNQKQSKINKDLIIFLGFLLGIIIWIIWVNKELIKERELSSTSSETVVGTEETKDAQEK